MGAVPEAPLLRCALSAALLLCAFLSLSTMSRASVSYEARSGPADVYSSYKCQGGNQPGPLTPFRGSMNTHGEFDEKPLTLHKRSCELRNVCFHNGKLSYFMDPTEERLVSRHDRIDGFAKDDFVLLGKRDVALNVDTVCAPVPKSFSWSRAKVAIYQSHSWSENFGHALLDDALGAFKLMHTHMRVTSSAQVVFHENCNVIYGPGIVTGTISGQTALDRCQKFEDALSCGISTRKPMHLLERRRRGAGLDGDADAGTGAGPGAVAVSQDTNNLCFERVLVGASAMSLRHEHLGTAAIYQSFRQFFMSNLGIETPAPASAFVSASDSDTTSASDSDPTFASDSNPASASASDSDPTFASDSNPASASTSDFASATASTFSYARRDGKQSASRRGRHRHRHPRPRNSKQLVTFFVKTHGQSHLDVDPESIRALAERVHVEMQVDVDVFDPATLSIKEQVTRLVSTTVLVTPMGGIDATSVFVSPRASVVYVGKREGLMFSGHVYSHAGPHVLFLNATGKLTWGSIRSHLFKSLLAAEKEFGFEHSFLRP